MPITKETSCDGKAHYESRGDAKKAAVRMQKLKKSAHLRVYKCQFCIYYHIGNLPRWVADGRGGPSK